MGLGHSKDVHEKIELEFFWLCGLTDCPMWRLRLMLFLNLDVNFTTKYGLTALMNAARHGSLYTIKLLLQNKANVNQTDENGLSPLHFACSRSHRCPDRANVMRELLLSGANPNLQSKKDATPAMLVIEDAVAVKLLIESGAKVDSISSKGKTLAVFAVIRNALETFKVLYAHGIDIQWKDGNKKTLLMFAAEHNSTDVASFLIQCGADLEQKDKNGDTALSYAAKSNATKTVEFLLDKEAIVNTAARDGRTPLMLAVKNNCAKTVSTLLSYEARIDQTAGKGETALCIAAENDSTESASLLIQHNANVNHRQHDSETPLILVAKYDSLGVAKQLLAENVQTNYKNNLNETALCVAVKRNSKNVAELLFETERNVPSELAQMYKELIDENVETDTQPSGEEVITSEETTESSSLRNQEYIEGFLSDESLYEIAKKVGHEQEQLATLLYIPKYTLEIVQRNKRFHEDVTYEILTIWRKNNSNKSYHDKVIELKTVFNKLRRRDVTKFIDELQKATKNEK